jgi:predicted nucleotide-binding protein
MAGSRELFDKVRLRRAVLEVEERLRNQLQKGKEIKATAINNEGDLAEAEREMEKWERYTRSLLEVCIDGPSFIEDFRLPYYGIAVGGLPLTMRAEDFRDDMLTMIASLESVIERLPLITQDPPSSGKSTEKPETIEAGRRVFIVHGHDNEMKQTVARVIEKLGLEAVILHERPTGGLTVIEKLEKYGQYADYAVVLLSPDDEGREKGVQELASRPRQNVVFELGYFIGKLKRHRSCAIVKGTLDITSDVSGVVYIPMDDGGGWKADLVAELRMAGFKVTADSLIPNN